MTVAELIAELQKFDPALPVVADDSAANAMLPVTGVLSYASNIDGWVVPVAAISTYSGN